MLPKKKVDKIFQKFESFLKICPPPSREILDLPLFW